jgi:hypothetical protein
MSLKKLFVLVVFLQLGAWTIVAADPTHGGEIVIHPGGNGEVVPVIHPQPPRPIDPAHIGGHPIGRHPNGRIDVPGRIDHNGVIDHNRPGPDPGVIDGRLRLPDPPHPQPYDDDSSDVDGGADKWTRVLDHEIKFLEGSKKPILCLDSKGIRSQN